MSANANELLEEVKCYACLGLSQAELLKLAILSRIQSGSASANWEYTRVEAPGLQYVFFASTNTIIELACRIDSRLGAAAILVTKEHDSGPPLSQTFGMDDGAAFELSTIITVFLRANDLLTVSSGGGTVNLDSVNIYEQQ